MVIHTTTHFITASDTRSIGRGGGGGDRVRAEKPVAEQTNSNFFFTRQTEI